MEHLVYEEEAEEEEEEGGGGNGNGDGGDLEEGRARRVKKPVLSVPMEEGW